MLGDSPLTGTHRTKAVVGPFRVALTGGIGSGKSAAASCFEALGAEIIDADALSHELSAPGAPAAALIEQQLGPGLVDADGVLDRARLRRIVFADTAKRKTLESILHPLIRRRIGERLEQCKKPYCMLVIPLLIESGLQDLAQRVLVVDAPPELCVERVAARDRQPAEEVRRIIAVQVTREQRLAAADDVLQNSGTLEQLQHEVGVLHQKYLQYAAGQSRADPR